jgi:hypothetical protein
MEKQWLFFPAQFFMQFMFRKIAMNNGVLMSALFSSCVILKSRHADVSIKGVSFTSNSPYVLETLRFGRRTVYFLDEES